MPETCWDNIDYQ